ncbi:MAG: phage tail sheath subtilisin-like domain-containing protein [Pseudomonadota bacterium]
MVELLAPGVYTIETSFRARSIQGVGTSTTGFVGMARSGPVGGPPQLVTSFAEYERIYGGLTDMTAEGVGAGGTNYLAHAVRAFFNEMGSRLYVSRAFSAQDGNDGRARVPLRDFGPDSSFEFMARFPGSAGNGTLEVSEVVTPASPEVVSNAAVGSMARTRGSAATPASLTATAAPADLSGGGVIDIAVDGGPTQQATLVATPAVLTFTAPADTVSIPAGTNLLITVDGLRQVISLGGDGTDRTVAQISQAIRAGLQRATLTRSGRDFTITSDVSGSGITMSVEALPVIGAAAASDAGDGVSRSDRVTASDLNAAFATDGVTGVRAVAAAGTGIISLVSDTAGAPSSIDISGTAEPIRSALGFQTTNATGSALAPQAYFIRVSDAAAGWHRYTEAAPDWTTDSTLIDPTPELDPNGFLVALNFTYTNADQTLNSYEGMSLVPGHPRYFLSRMRVLTPTDIANGAQEPVADPLQANVPGNLNAVEAHAAIFATGTEDEAGVRRVVLGLTGGNDGMLPSLGEWEDALAEMNRYDDIAIIAAPGSSAYALVGQSMRASLTAHAASNGFRIAVLDPPLGETLDSLRTTRGQIDSSYAALYAPWIRIANPLARPGDESTPRDILVPPSGHICGIYARNDQLRGVHKTPANEVVRSAIGFETDYNQATQGVLNPLGINCLRTLSGRGHRVYGGRLATSDREVLYVSDRRYLNFVKRSLYESMQWAVFEPNGPELWGNIREAIASFLYNQWFNGALFGTTPDEAFFVICDRSVMTQADLDNGRCIAQVGMALLKPAEFVVFNIGQKTADMGV